MIKRKIFIIIFLFLIGMFIFSEVIVMKDKRVINGKIIKMNEDTVTVITKKEEIVIDRENIRMIYNSEKEYEENKKKDKDINVKTKEVNKEDTEAPYIVKVDPPNGAKNILSSRYKEILITFNEPMRTGVSFHYNFNPGRNIKINWINQYTVQILLDVELKPSVEYKVLLNDTENKKYNIKDLNGNILKEDTAVSFGTASEEMEKKFKIIEKQAENGVIINKSKYAWLGIKTENINNEIRKEFNIKPLVKGIIIKEVSSNSPASKAGLKENDIIQSMFDEKINNKENFDFYINNLYLGSKIKLKIYRNGDIIEQEIKLDVSQKK